MSYQDQHSKSEHRCPSCGHALIQTFNRLDCPQSIHCGWPGVVMPAEHAPFRKCKVLCHGEHLQARFHQWDNGQAIVEYEDGRCESIRISEVQFIPGNP